MLKTMLLVAHLLDSSPAFAAVSRDAEVEVPVQVTAVDGTLHVLHDGIRAGLIARSGQRREFGADGSITVYETDGRTWRL